MATLLLIKKKETFHLLTLNKSLTETGFPHREQKKRGGVNIQNRYFLKEG